MGKRMNKEQWGPIIERAEAYVAAGGTYKQFAVENGLKEMSLYSARRDRNGGKVNKFKKTSSVKGRFVEFVPKTEGRINIAFKNVTCSVESHDEMGLRSLLKVFTEAENESI